ncbi:poly-gamma-glutamate biosynthesis protein PgsC/CapC [Streptomyces sp. NPDC002092]
MIPAGLSPVMAAIGIALGLLSSLICYLTTKLSPGGLITPGWLALTLLVDWRLFAMVLGAGAVTYGCTRVLQRHVILYGKRLFAAVVMCGVLIQGALYLALRHQFPYLFSHQPLGYLVPGLIAYQLVRQSPRATLMAMTTITVGVYIALDTGALLVELPTV